MLVSILWENQQFSNSWFAYPLPFHGLQFWLQVTVMVQDGFRYVLHMLHSELQDYEGVSNLAILFS